MKLKLGNNIELLKTLEPNSIDSIVTDPPYGLKFMGKKWDYQVPTIEFWKEAYRVLKPGGHVLSFGGTRTYHRMVVNIEDAGFEIRDQIQWIYGSGFPKSLNIGKAVDKIQGNEREVVGTLENYQDKKGNGHTSVYEDAKSRIDINITKGTTPFEGQGTALKPANEPICLARKPISEDTIAANVLKWGTGGINIDGCRIPGQYGLGKNEIIEDKEVNIFNNGLNKTTGHKNKIMVSNELGRFPANIIFDEEAGEVLDFQTGLNCSRFFYCAKVSKAERNMGLDNVEGKEVIRQGLAGEKDNPIHKNSHPTIKPIQLMSYLCRLITPKGGIVLDPFMGSGSTGIAARLEGFDFIGMEMDPDYFKIAEVRIQNFEKYKKFMKVK